MFYLYFSRKPFEDRYEAQRQAILIIHTLIEFDSPWISTQTDIIGALKTIWKNDLYKVSSNPI